MQQHHLEDGGNDDEAIEPIEHRHQIRLETEAVHFEETLESEENEEDEIADVLEGIEPRRLSVMLRRQDASVEEDHDDDSPVEKLGFDDLPDFPPDGAVDALKLLLLLDKPKELLLLLHFAVLSRGFVDRLQFLVFVFFVLLQRGMGNVFIVFITDM